MKKTIIALFMLASFVAPAFSMEPAVSRSQFTTAVANREPSDNLSHINRSEFGDRLFYFSELSNMQGTSVRHVWHVNDNQVFERRINPTSPRFRYNTSISNAHFNAGDTVRVDVMGDDDRIFTSDSLEIR
ncbi:MAG: DUF2914 domain-containing protein [Elusimicrobia bacterium]|nr:DUF2914 domain-containing protein [Elusimicrobiota bacterium]